MYGPLHNEGELTWSIPPETPCEAFDAFMSRLQALCEAFLWMTGNITIGPILSLFHYIKFMSHMSDKCPIPFWDMPTPFPCVFLNLPLLPLYGPIRI